MPRPKEIEDKKAYMREYMRQRRAKQNSRRIDSPNKYMKQLEEKIAGSDDDNGSESSALPANFKPRSPSAKRFESWTERKAAEAEAEAQKSRNILQLSVAMNELPKIDAKDPAAVADRGLIYLQICDKMQLKPTVAGLAIAYGLTRVTLLRIVTGENSWDPDARAEMCRMYNVIVSVTESYVLEGKNPIGGMFLMRNNMGYQNEDKPMAVHEEERQDVESIMDKYKDLPEE